MMKKVIVFIFILFLIILGLIGYQWYVYKYQGQGKTGKEQKKDITYQIDIVHKSNTLFIKETLLNLQQDKFEARVPKSAKNIKCTTNEKEKCKIVQSTKNALLHTIGESTVKIEYEIPLNTNQRSFILEEWYVKLLKNKKDEVLKGNYEVTVTEDINIGSTWAAGTTKKADVIKEYLHLYAWEGFSLKGFPLYLTKASLNEVEFEKFNVLSETKAPLNLKSKWISSLQEGTGLTVILTKENMTHIRPNLVVLPERLSIKEKETAILTAALLGARPPKNDNERFLWYSLPTVILNDAVGQEKVGQISSELLSSLPKETRKKFADWLLAGAKDEMTAKQLDEKLSQLFKHDTNFFVKNVTKKEFVPLYFIDRRLVFLDDNLFEEDYEAIVRNGKIYLPLKKVLESFEFSVELVSGDAYYIKRDNQSWRLFMNEPYFTKNEVRYELPEKPLEKLDGTVYMSEQFFEQLMSIDVVKRDSEIELQLLK